MVTLGTLGLMAFWPVEVQQKLGTGQSQEVRPSWSPLRS